MGERPRALTGFSFFYHRVGDNEYVDMHSHNSDRFMLRTVLNGASRYGRFIFHDRADSWLPLYQRERERLLRGRPDSAE